MEATGSTLICAFESGVVRVVTVAVLQANEYEDIYGDYVRLIQVLKPHTLAITAMSMNSSNSLLVTGSEDLTIFAFSIEITDTYPNLIPLGYVKVSSGITCMTWKPAKRNVILVGCARGDCAEVELPEKPQAYTTISYELVECAPKCFKFQSTKSAIQRELMRLEIEEKKEAERDARRQKMERIRAENPGIDIDEEVFLSRSSDDY